MARALPAEELADRAAAWARSDERVLAAFGYGSLARGDANDWSDLDLLVVVKPGTRDAMWAEREEIAGRILAGDGVVFSQELAWQRPFRFQAWRKDGLQVDLTFDEGQAEPWDGIAGGFLTLFDRDNLAEQLRSALSQWRPVEPHVEVPNWIWLKYLASRLRRGQLWLVRSGLVSFVSEEVVPLLGVTSNAVESTLSPSDQRRLHAALPASADPDELARALRASAELYDYALDVWASRTGHQRPRHPLESLVRQRIDEIDGPDQ
ncbi:MAG TPA: nucleotidyltransferase domain-containing protein [Actinopolymorphaceae bacterium]